MSEETGEARVEAKVGRWLPDGTFTGNLVRFTGSEVGSYTDYTESRSGDDRGTTYTLYRSGSGASQASPGYRVHVDRWTKWQGEESEAFLYPMSADEEPTEEGSYPPVEYGSYTEAGAREAYPHLFAALGRPNVHEID